MVARSDMERKGNSLLSTWTWWKASSHCHHLKIHMQQRIQALGSPQSSKPVWQREASTNQWQVSQQPPTLPHTLASGWESMHTQEKFHWKMLATPPTSYTICPLPLPVACLGSVLIGSPHPIPNFSQTLGKTWNCVARDEREVELSVSSFLRAPFSKSAHNFAQRTIYAFNRRGNKMEPWGLPEGKVLRRWWSLAHHHPVGPPCQKRVEAI